MNVSKTWIVIDVSDRNLVFALQYNTISQVNIIIRSRESWDSEESTVLLASFRVFPGETYSFLARSFSSRCTTIGYINLKLNLNHSLSYTEFYPFTNHKRNFSWFWYASALERLFLLTYMKETSSDPILVPNREMSPDREYMWMSHWRYGHGNFLVSEHVRLILQYLHSKKGKPEND